MISKIAIVATLFAVAHAGHEAPPAKAHTYSVPSVAKVSYPAPTITKSVETYSAPSIEKTTTIIRTITSPLNAPPVKSIQYSAPAAPIVKAAVPAVYAAPSFAAAPVAYAHAHAHAPAVLAHGYAAPATKIVSQPTLGLSVPSLGLHSHGLLAAYAPQQVGLTTYGSPSLGYSLGSYAAAPAATIVKAAPVAEYAHAHVHAH